MANSEERRSSRVRFRFGEDPEEGVTGVEGIVEVVDDEGDEDEFGPVILYEPEVKSM